MAAISWSKPTDGSRVAAAGAGGARCSAATRAPTATPPSSIRPRTPRRSALSSFTRISRAAAWAPGCWSAASATRSRTAFARFELMATLPGVRLYAARGYVGDDTGRLAARRAALSIRFLPMSKTGAAISVSHRARRAPRTRRTILALQKLAYRIRGAALRRLESPAAHADARVAARRIRRLAGAQGARRRRCSSVRCARGMTAAPATSAGSSSHPSCRAAASARG